MAMGVTLATGALLLSSPAKAQERGRAAGFRVDFRLNSSTISTSYMHTGETLRALADSIAAAGIANIDSLNVRSFSSPEGRHGYNLRLSERRADAIGDYLRLTYPSLADRISISAGGESWQLFREQVTSDPSLSEEQRPELLRIIGSDASAEEKKTMLRAYDGKLWAELVRSWFPEMRRSFITLKWTESRTAFPSVPALDGDRFPTPEAVAPESGISAADSRDTRRRRTVFALKTNLLYDAVTALNFELEVPLGERFSIAIEDVFPWWNWGPGGNKYCFQIWEMGIELRRWFSGTPGHGRLCGHFVAPYIMSGIYDLQWDRSLCLQGEFVSAGISYGFSFPVGKVCNLELAVSAGFLSSDWRHYQPDGDYGQLYRDPFRYGKLSYFGPTKLKVSAVFPIRMKYGRASR